MGKITLIIGGARSGKSAFACRLAARHKKVAFIATGQPRDKEMKKRIRVHKSSRPETWATFEEPEQLETLLKKLKPGFDIILIDCLTLWVSNLLLKKTKETDILDTFRATLALLKKKKCPSVIVSNEVGLGLVPLTPLGRKFRDIAGRVNQCAAEMADDVFLTVSGIPVKIKRKT
jgi:adenosylcobinamide kinase/adenosylcobinamide-phosphate guanylyltransferase